MFNNISSICEYQELAKTELAFKVSQLPLNPAVYESMQALEGLKCMYPRIEPVLRERQVGICFAYLKAFCFTTLGERLYDVTQKLLGVANPGKMKEIVLFLISEYDR